ncbi:ABC transporter permease [Paenibacillus hemerocallicola]|uniref:ABC transporter permease n=1 Tax=Paenibacillus hemerocallicola TaxID=1172614 RepID=A0A5C4THA8_9BACL|nr:ABC transporter permease [Paenibacillus hemerocallicola]TNJ68132.1 ABC transporter permease [Paenibacillus hemerocallicola]
MAILVMIFRKMLKNKWLELSLLFGLVLSVALVSSMPIYTEAILQRMLVKELENYQVTSGSYPLTYRTGLFLTGETPKENGDSARNVDQFMQSMGSRFDLPIRAYVKERGTDTFAFTPKDTERMDASVKRNVDIVALSDFEEHVKLVDGVMPAKEPVNGVFEVLVVESALTQLKMVLGNEFVIEDERVKNPITVKPVGVINPKDEHDLFWNTPLESYGRSFIMNYETFEKYITGGNDITIRAGFWYYALEYSRMDMGSIESFIRTHQRIESYITNTFPSQAIKAPALGVISKYMDRQEQLRVMLWSLNVPVMIMLGFYLFMVSNLIVERQKTEIAVLRSRGASRMQILLSYVIEGVMLGAVAFAIGPYAGMALTNMLGASNGFLEFVQRSALIVTINSTAYKYALYAVGFSLIMTLIPAFLATRTSIVGHKQQMARMSKMSFTHKYFIDILLLGVSLYGLQSFKRRMSDLQSLGLDSANFKVDPLLFLVPALFTLGLGLLLLRVYPLFIRLVYWLGRKVWPPSLYSTLIQVGRSSNQYNFLMVFLMITLATGLFSASAARTMNSNTLEKVKYKNGTDIILNVKWENDAPPPMMGGGEEAEEETEAVTTVPIITGPKRIQYTEPPFQVFSDLPGVASAAKVFVKDDAVAQMGKTSSKIKLMGVDTDEFGKTAYMKDRLLEHHFYDYLNLISTEPSAVLVSRTMADEMGVKEGDSVNIGWNNVSYKPFTIYGIIDYWPTFNPNPQQPTSGNAKKPELPKVVVGHLSYIQSAIALEPYQVWIDLKDEPTSKQTFNEALNAKEIPIESFIDTGYELTLAKNDPFQMAINGVMTLGFLISVVISFFGFLLYWVLSLNGRVLQYGILRAMGISFMQLIGMLVTEQVLTSGAAFLIGAGIGNVTSLLFVPLFQLSFNSTTQVPPFQVMFDSTDSTRLYIIVTIMITIGLGILGYLLSRIKIHQAVKLGED